MVLKDKYIKIKVRSKEHDKFLLELKREFEKMENMYPTMDMVNRVNKITTLIENRLEGDQ